MTLLIILGIIVAYLLVGFLLNAKALPYFIYTSLMYRLGRDPRLSDVKYNREMITGDVRVNTYAMIFGWPVWGPVTLAHAQSGHAIRRYDPYDAAKLRALADHVELRQIQAANGQDDDDDDDTAGVMT